MVQIAFESFASAGCQTVFGFWHPTLKALTAFDVLRFFQPSRVNAQISIRGLQQALQLVKRKRIVDGQSADNSKAHPFVDDSVQIWQSSFDGCVLVACLTGLY